MRARARDEAAKELGVELLFDGPTEPDPAKQNEIVENWITLGVDVIAVGLREQGRHLHRAAQGAASKGIKVVTYDSDAHADARDFFVNQATPEGIGNTLMDEAARLLGGEGEFAIITASLTAANMNEWQKHIEARLAEKYPKMKIVALRPCDDLKDKAQPEATDAPERVSESETHHGHLLARRARRGGSGEAGGQSRRGQSHRPRPAEREQRYVKDGVTQAVILWKVEDLGYLTIQAAPTLANGELKPGATNFDAGRLGKLKIEGDNIVLGQPFIFTKENIDQFDF